MLILLDRDETFIASLKHNKIQRKRELNGANNLEFETNREVEFGQRIIFQDKMGIWNEYIIIDYFKTHGEDGVIYEVYNEDSTSELYGFFIEDMKPRNALASKVLADILQPTRFEVGYVDDFGKKSFNLYRTSVKAALWKMLEVYQAEIQVRIEVEKNGRIHRYIDLRHAIGRNVGKRFTYKKDIGSIKKTTSTKDLVTALYGFGKGEEVVGDDGQPTGGYGRKIDFADINGGKKYVADEEARKKYGLGKERVHIFGSVDFDDCEDKKELLDLTKEKLKEVSKPKITYELNVEDISKDEGYIGESVDLGEIVLVKDEVIDTLVETRVIAIKDNPIEEVLDSEIVLGNFIKDISDNIVAYDKLKSIFENDRNRFNNELEKLANGVKSSYIQSVLDKFNKELNETGGFVYAEEGEGLLILNAPREGNPTQAINLKGGMIAIANHKNADGSFAYETFGDGNGFTANLIRAGILRGGNVFFNLEDGTFLIGASKTDYSMYWDGNALHFRNVDIDLKNNRTIKELEESNKAMKHDTDSQLQTLKSNLQLTDGKLTSEISSLRSDISTGDSNLKSYVVNNYSSISQTSGMIESKLSSVKSSVSSLTSRLSSAESSIKQTSSEIESKISSVKSSVSSLTGRLSSAESSIKQTSSEISSKISKNGVISAINQSSESIKIKASKIDLDGDVTLSGRFTTYKDSYKSLDMNGSSIDLYDPKNDHALMGKIKASFETTVRGRTAYNYPNIMISHNDKGMIAMAKGIKYTPESDYYILLDKNEHINKHNGYPIVFYQNTEVRGRLKVGEGWDYNRQTSDVNGEITLGSWKLESKHEYEYNDTIRQLIISEDGKEVLKLRVNQTRGTKSIYFNGVKIR